MKTKVKRISAFNYFGGKSRFLDWLLPLFPDERSYKHYVEPFCGSCVVLLNKKPSPIETINDLDTRILNFFRVLRERPDDLVALLQLTPYSRSEYQYARKVSEDPLEEARRFFVRVMQCYGGGGHGENSRRINSWRTQLSESRGGRSMEVSKWFNKIQGLTEAAHRLLNCQIDNRDALECITKYDGPETFFYCDPPYDHVTRTGKTDYNHELSNEQHVILSELLHTCKAKVAISGYKGGLINKLFKDWQPHLGPDRCTNLGKTKLKREMLWTNYDALGSNRFLFN